MRSAELTDTQRAFLAALPVARAGTPALISDDERWPLIEAKLIAWEPDADEWWPTDLAFELGLI